MDITFTHVRPTSTGGTAVPEHSALREAADKLEGTFLAEMLKHAGFGKPSEAWGGGVGEDQFSSFLTRFQAEAMVEAGGIGLAEFIFESLKERANG